MASGCPIHVSKRSDCGLCQAGQMSTTTSTPDQDSPTAKRSDLPPDDGTGLGFRTSSTRSTGIGDMELEEKMRMQFVAHFYRSFPDRAKMLSFIAIPVVLLRGILDGFSAYEQIKKVESLATALHGVHVLHPLSGLIGRLVLQCSRLSILVGVCIVVLRGVPPQVQKSLGLTVHTCARVLLVLQLLLTLLEGILDEHTAAYEGLALTLFAYIAIPHFWERTSMPGIYTASRVGISLTAQGGVDKSEGLLIAWLFVMTFMFWLADRYEYRKWVLTMGSNTMISHPKETSFWDWFCMFTPLKTFSHIGACKSLALPHSLMQRAGSKGAKGAAGTERSEVSDTSGSRELQSAKQDKPDSPLGSRAPSLKPIVADSYFPLEEWPAILKMREDEEREMLAREADPVPFKSVASVAVLASGTYGTVHQVTDLVTGEQLAMKIAREQESAVEALMLEVMMLRILSHPRIVSFVGVCEHELTGQSLVLNSHEGKNPEASLVLELGYQGTLCGLLHGAGPVDEFTARWFMNDLLEAVYYLHRHCLIHRDIKPSNCIIQNHHLKLADFGACTAEGLTDVSTPNALGYWGVKLKGSSLAMKVRGTAPYMSPELLVQKKCSRKVDIWAIGVVAMEMLTLEVPTDGYRDEVQALKTFLEQGKVPMKSEFVDAVSANAVSFVSDCFVVSVRKRPSVFHLLRHPFMTEGRRLRGEGEVHSDSVAPSSPSQKAVLPETVVRALAMAENKTKTISHSAQLVKKSKNIVFKIWDRLNAIENPFIDAETEEKYNAFYFDRRITRFRKIMMWFLPIAKTVSLFFNYNRYIEKPILQGILDFMLACLLYIVFTPSLDSKFVTKFLRHSSRFGTFLSVLANHTQPKASVIPFMSVGFCIGGYAGSWSFAEIAMWQAFTFVAILKTQVSTVLKVGGVTTIVPLGYAAEEFDSVAFAVELDRSFKMMGVMLASFSFALHSFWVVRMEERNQFRYGEMARAKHQVA